MMLNKLLSKRQKNNYKTCFFCLLFCFLNYLIYSQEITKKEKSFIHETYGVKAHTGATFATLPNGLKVILLPNQEPANQVYIKMHIESGSLNETDEQIGYSHLLQHLAFCKTKSYEKDAIIKILKNANENFEIEKAIYTDFDRSVFSIKCNNSDHIPNAFLVLNEILSYINFNKIDIETEVEKIFIEKKENETPEYKAQFAIFQYAFEGSNLLKHFPVNAGDHLKKASPESIYQYYKTWYRPEITTLIVVGDFNRNKVFQMIRETFKSSNDYLPAKPNNTLSPISHKGLIINNYFDASMSETKVEIRTIHFSDMNDNFYNARKKMLTEAAIMFIMKKRWNVKFKTEELPFTKGKIVLGNLFSNVYFANLWVTCNKEQYDQAILFLKNELDSIIKNGFDKSELELFKKEYLGLLEKSILNTTKIDSYAYAEQISASISKRIPFQDPQQVFELEKPILENLNIENLVETIQNYWDKQHRLISVLGNAEIKSPIDTIKSIYNSENK